MACFVKGVGLVRTAYKSGVSLRSAQVDFIAGNLNIRPQASGVDALSSVTVTDKSYGKAMITDPASLTELHLPNTYLAIGNNALDACVNLTDVYIYAGQVIDIGTSNFAGTYHVDTEFLSAYEARYPLLTFAAFDSGYTQTIPYVEGVTPTTLTAQYVNDWVAQIGDPSAVGRVIVPAYFTAYASGAITAIQTAFANMEHLITTYSGGTIDLDMNGDIVAKIVSIGKTVDEALVYARSYVPIYVGNASIQADQQLIILPPIRRENGHLYIKDNPNLVYVPYASGNENGGYEVCSNNPNLVEFNFEYQVKATNWLSLTFNGNLGSLKRTTIAYPYGTSQLTASNQGIPIPASVEKVLLYGYAAYLDVRNATLPTRQALVDLLNSLGTPTERKQTVFLGATNLAKLTNADIQLAYDKNWLLDPTPAAFALEIGSDTYSCDFGMTWEQWVASAYNTDGYYVSAGSVYDSNDNIVRLNGTNVKASGMVRYGDSYTHNTTTVAYTYTIPFEGNTELTAAALEGIEVNTDTTAYRVTKVIVPADFTSYGAACFDGLDSLLPSCDTLELRGGGDWVFETIYPSNNTKIKNVVDARTTATATGWNGSFRNYPNALDSIRTPNLVALPYTYINRTNASTKINTFIGDLATSYGSYTFAECRIKTISLPSLVDASVSKIGDAVHTDYVLLPSVTYIGNYVEYGWAGGRATYCHFYLGTPNCQIAWTGAYQNQGLYEKVRFYVPAQYLVSYVDGTNGANWQNWDTLGGGRLIGYLDYTDTIPTFSGYTDTWYSDEDCTTPIATSAFVSGNRYYVKLTALITFTIGGQSYNATPNMTWTQWVASAYNTIGFTISNNIVTDGGSHGVSTTIMGQDWVDPSATISATEYHLVAL